MAVYIVRDHETVISDEFMVHIFNVHRFPSQFESNRL